MNKEDLKIAFLKELEHHEYIFEYCSICDSGLPVFAIDGVTYINTGCRCVPYSVKDKPINIDRILDDVDHLAKVKKFCGIKD